MESEAQRRRFLPRYLSNDLGCCKGKFFTTRYCMRSVIPSCDLQSFNGRPSLRILGDHLLEAESPISASCGGRLPEVLCIGTDRLLGTLGINYGPSCFRCRSFSICGSSHAGSSHVLEIPGSASPVHAIDLAYLVPYMRHRGPFQCLL